MKKTVFLLMILTVFTKIIGFVREIVLSYYYGASGISDAYLVSLTIPTLIFSFIGVGLSTTFIPIYNYLFKEQGIESTRKFTNNVITVLFAASLIIMIGILIFTVPIVKIFALGFEGETLELAIKLTQITSFSILMIGMINILGSYLQTEGSYIAPVTINLPLDIVSIISITLSFLFATELLAYGRVVAVFAQLLFLIPFLYKKKYVYRFVFDLKDDNLKKVFHLAIPVIIGTSVNQINKLIDRTIASMIAIGGVSSITYANRLNLFIQGIFVTSLSTVLFATISKMAAAGNIDGLKKSLSEAINVVNILVIPAAIGSMVFAEPVVTLLFGRGAFDANAVLNTSAALFYYSIGMVAFGNREVLTLAFYSLRDTRTPTINAVVGMSLNIVLNIILSRYLGIGGLALATSISAIVISIMMFISLRKKIGKFGVKAISISFMKVIFASLIMGITAKLSFIYFSSNFLSQNLSLIVSITIGVIVYFTLICFMKIKDVDIIVTAIKRKISIKDV